MIIYLPTSVYKDKALFDAIEKEFGGITVDKPDFEESDGECAWSEDTGYDAVSYVTRINRFIEEYKHGAFEAVNDENEYEE